MVVFVAGDASHLFLFGFYVVIFEFLFHYFWVFFLAVSISVGND